MYRKEKISILVQKTQTNSLQLDFNKTLSLGHGSSYIKNYRNKHANMRLKSLIYTLNMLLFFFFLI